MHDDVVCTGISEGFQVAIRALNHQMRVEGKLGGFSSSGYDEWPESHVRDKMPVHHIEMEPIGSPALGLSYLICES
jgi:hypothetical protein